MHTNDNEDSLGQKGRNRKKLMGGETNDTKPSKDVICSYWDSERVQGGEEALSSQRILPLGDIRAAHMSAYTGCSSLQL